MEEIWQTLMRETKGRRIKKVNIVLHGLVEEKNLHVQADLFDTVTPAAAIQRQARNEKLSNAMDKLNQKFGRDTILLGMTANQDKSGTGTKIAFTRIPDMQEFVE